MNNDELRNKDNEIMTPLAARLWNHGASYAWSDVDIKESPSEYVFSFDIPESQRDNIRIWVSGGRLFVSGKKVDGNRLKGAMESENRNGRYYRNFRLPLPVDEYNIFAQFVDGALIVVIPKILKESTYKINLN